MDKAQLYDGLLIFVIELSEIPTTYQSSPKNITHTENCSLLENMLS